MVSTLYTASLLSKQTIKPKLSMNCVTKNRIVENSQVMLTLRIKHMHYLYENSLLICPRKHGRTKKKRLFLTGAGRSITEIFEYNNIEIKGIFREDFSAKNFNRPEWKKLITIVRNRSKEGEWSEWDKVDNTFVFNINENGDIAHIRANGKTIIYKKLTGVEKSKTDDGEEYQIMNALDEDGNVFRLQIFDNPSVGLKMMYGDIMVQFAKY